MAVEVSGSQRAHWLVGESDFGGPMVEHVHADGSVVAYVLPEPDGREVAQCTACGERKRLARRREDAGAPTL